MSNNTNDFNPNDIAIIGMAGRFPGAENIADYWSNIVNAREAGRELSDEELRQKGVAEKLLRDENYVKSGKFLNNYDCFDAALFGFSPMDAEIADPQHRQFLEVVWEALDNAGYDTERYDGAIGVFAGSGHNVYMPYNLFTNPKLVNDVGLFLLRHTANDKDFLSTRVSYQFNLRGPSINVQTACSTSLVATHLAVQSLLSGECDIALAGGVTINLPHDQGYLYKEGEILSPDGHCRPFDADAQGTVFGSGAGVLVLKRLEDAYEDGDYIHALIKSTAINNDGAGKVSYLAPSVDGQAAAVKEALSLAEIDPATIQMVECHGTGTPMGDPIEVAALAQAFQDTEGQVHCALSSVKSNIGHLDTAAGVAGLIKAVQAIKHDTLPPTVHFQAANPSLDFQEGMFYVPSQAEPWPRSEAPKRAGVSSLGVGGTNAHLIVEEAPAYAMETSSTRENQLLVLSANSLDALTAQKAKLAEYLRQHNDLPNNDLPKLHDIAFTLQVGRKELKHRQAWVCSDTQAFIDHLSNSPVSEEGFTPFVEPSESISGASRLAFMFAGGGAQYAGMGRELYEKESVYRQTVDECLALLAPHIDFDLAALLFDADAKDPAIQEQLEKPSRALPALFITQYAQAKLWLSWGVEPEAMIGHSMGEYTAACLAGVFSVADALHLVAVRGALFESLAPGGMLSVNATVSDIQAYLNDAHSIAAENGPELTVISGPAAAIDTLQSALDTDEIPCQRVRINVAAHSSMLEPILQPFREVLNTITFHTPEKAFISNLIGDWAQADLVCNAEYWVRHLRETVRFASGLKLLLEPGDFRLIEVGPGRTLSTFANIHPDKPPQVLALNSLRHPNEAASDVQYMLKVLGQLWCHGLNVDWSVSHDEARRRVPLPSYAFEHKRYWVEAGNQLALDDSASLDKHYDPERWFYAPSWLSSPLGHIADIADKTNISNTLLFVGHHAWGDKLAQHLAELAPSGVTITVVREGSHYQQLADNEFCMDWQRSEDYEQLLSQLEGDKAPSTIIHTLALDDAPPELEQATSYYFDSLFYASKALADSQVEASLKWYVLSQNASQINGEWGVQAVKSLLKGPVGVLPSEYPSWTATHIDLDIPEKVEQQVLLQKQVIQELSQDITHAAIAYRGLHRFVWQMQATALPSVGKLQAVKEQGVYLISGGLGGIGLSLAKVMSQHKAVKFVLCSRTEYPEQSAWQHIIEQKGTYAEQLSLLMDITQQGSEVMLAKCDLTSLSDVQALKDKVQQHWGDVNGIIHAAGVLDDELSLLKQTASMHKVLAPKVDGTVYLAEVFANKQLDFMVLCSSVSSFAGIAGQFDYAAANAFLDAFAGYNTHHSTRTIAINWSAWQEVGMAAKMLSGSVVKHELDLPSFDAYYVDGEQTVYQKTYRVADDWLLNEHQIRNGVFLIPGTGYLEIVRAGFLSYAQQKFSDIPQDATVVLQDIYFLSPFIVPEDEEKDLLLSFTDIDDHQCDFVITSVDGQEHARGCVGLADYPAIENLDINAIEQRCSLRFSTYTDQNHHPHLAFGARWDCLKQVGFGASEAIAQLALPDIVLAELEQYPLHPAVLDMATGCAQSLMNGEGMPSQLFVPSGYAKLHFKGALTSELRSYIKYRAPVAEQGDIDIAVFDIFISDMAGKILVVIEEFTMQKVKADNIQDLVQTSAHVTEGDASHLDDEKQRAISKTLSLGLLPDEGAEAFLRIIEHGYETQYAVSTHDLQSLLKELNPPSASSHESVVQVEDDEKLFELEKLVGQHESLVDVIIRDFSYTDQTQRVAFYVVGDEDDVTVSELRKFARQIITDPSEVPQHFVECEVMPQSKSGHVDRYQLENPFAPEDSFVAPETKTEVLLAQVWQQVLGVEKVGRHDNFFDIGGHSLLSIRVITKLNKQLKVKLTQASMVLQTLEQIAKDIDNKLGVDSQSSDVVTKSKTENSVDHSRTSHAKVEDNTELSNEGLLASGPTQESSSNSNSFFKKVFGRK